VTAVRPQDGTSSEADRATYREAVRRLTAEAKELRTQLTEVQRIHAQEIREMKAQLNEGISPELVVMRRQLAGWKNRALAAEGRLTEKRGPGSWDPPSAIVDDDYEAQVQRCTQNAERKYEQAQKRLKRAEARLLAAQQATKLAKRKKVIAELTAEVELRRDELADYERMMHYNPASASHRGRGGFRPISLGKTL
jgi:hypothetical protein